MPLVSRGVEHFGGVVADVADQRIGEVSFHLLGWIGAEEVEGQLVGAVISRLSQRS